LTTISQPRMEIGEIAANALIDLIRNPDQAKAFTRLLDARLVVRSSTQAVA
jgi:DNA-binding LacI/PurR family transcriptional regulator